MRSPAPHIFIVTCIACINAYIWYGGKLKLAQFWFWVFLHPGKAPVSISYMQSSRAYIFRQTQEIP